MSQRNKTMINKKTKDIARVLVKKGLSYRSIGEILNISHTIPHQMWMKEGFKIVDKLKGRKCVMCGSSKKFINDDLYTICQNCYDKIKSQTTKEEKVSKRVSAKKKSR